MLRFIRDAPSAADRMKMIEPIPWTVISAYLAALNQVVPQDHIADILQVGDACGVGYVGTTIFRILDEFSSVKIINMPNGATIQAKTESFNYGVVNNKLYRYNQDTL